MKKVFIDGGAHKGESVKHFYNVFPDANEYEVHSFEANPNLWELVEQEKTILHKFAIWDKDGEEDFWLSRFHNEGSTLLKKKTTGKVDYNKPIKVKTIDFSKWLQDNFTKDDYIVLKLDIEGAEYKVVDKMFNDGTLNWINEFWGELHLPNKIHSLPNNARDVLLKQLDVAGLKFKDWHVEL